MLAMFMKKSEKEDFW